ncbi:MAG: 50S ribosomal protein L6, partial [Halobacteriota archaeon]
MARTEIQLPEEVHATVDEVTVRVEGPNGSVEKRLWYPGVRIEETDDAIVLTSDADDRATSATLGTFESHLENMIQGVQADWEYRMKVVYS